jgi:hypothetical protein
MISVVEELGGSNMEVDVATSLVGGVKGPVEV